MNFGFYKFSLELELANRIFIIIIIDLEMYACVVHTQIYKLSGIRIATTISYSARRNINYIQIHLYTNNL